MSKYLPLNTAPKDIQILIAQRYKDDGYVQYHVGIWVEAMSCFMTSPFTGLAVNAEANEDTECFWAEIDPL